MYPRKVIIKSDKLKDLLERKSELVEQGRGVSEIMEKNEIRMDEIDKEITKIERDVDTSDIDQEARDLTERMNEIGKEMDAIKEKLHERLISSIPIELKDEYETLKKENDKLEKNRHKIAMKATKFSDKIIPVTRKLMKDKLENIYEDFETIKIEDGEIVGTIFSHLEEFENRFKKRKDKKEG